MDVYTAAQRTSEGMGLVGAPDLPVTLLSLKAVDASIWEEPPEVEFSPIDHKKWPRRVPKPVLRLVESSKLENA